MENYKEVWKVLDELVVMMRSKGVNVPKKVIADLRSAKALINMYNLDQSKIETLSKIEVYLGNIEQTLLYLTEVDVGKDLADEYLRKIFDARGKVVEVIRTVSSKLVHGVPRDQHWIRVRIDADMDKGEYEILAKDLNLSLRTQEDGFLIIHGEKDKIKELIKKVAEKRKGS